MAKGNDVVLIYFEDQPLAFARIEDITPDIKKDWYHVKLLLLQIPVQVVTWILRSTYIDGAEFTMGGKRMRLEKVVCPDEPDIPQDKDQIQAKTGGDKIINLADLKSKK
jgi:hypothetical protein